MTAAPPPAGSEPVEESPPRRRFVLHWRWLAPVALGLLGSMAALVLFTSLQSQSKPITRADIKEAIDASFEDAAQAPPRSTVVFQTILPSLVFIRTDGDAQRADSSGIGSGVIIRNDGMILTANHVVDGARTITVTFSDGTESKAEIVDRFPNDLAVLRAARGPELVIPAVLGGGVQVGDETFAVGNPLGLTASLSAGVISGLGRSISPPRTGIRLTDLIQFDAAVNPGSSGGPLLNRKGQVVGIVTALANPTNERSFTGIGFAVPLGAAGGGPGIPK